MLPQWVEPSPLTQNQIPAAPSHPAVPRVLVAVAKRLTQPSAQVKRTALPVWPVTSDSAQWSTGGVTVSASIESITVEFEVTTGGCGGGAVAPWTPTQLGSREPASQAKRTMCRPADSATPLRVTVAQLSQPP